MNRSSALLLAFVFLSGCQALAPVSPDGTPSVEDTTPAPEKPKVYSSFSEETVFSLLSAELAGQRNRFDIALDNYVTQAINTQDRVSPNAPSVSPNIWAPINRPSIPR